MQRLYCLQSTVRRHRRPVVVSSERTKAQRLMQILQDYYVMHLQKKCCVSLSGYGMLDKKGTSKAASAPNKKVIITKTGKVIELSDESGQAPVKQQESGVIEAIDNIVVLLKDKSEENVKYVKAYIEDLLNALMKTKWDKDTMLSQFDAEELRAKSFQVIKRLNMDMLV